MKKEVNVFVTTDEEVDLPLYASMEAAGADIKAYIKEDIVVLPGQRVLIPTGLRFGIPEGFEIQVRPRSGLALKHGISVLNSPGTIDSDYRGELKVILINHGGESFTITPWMRIAQIVIAPVYRAHFCKKQDLNETERAKSGFGSTGF